MEEGEYRDIYHRVNERRCIYEKSILSRQTMCEHAHRFCLADREGVACHDAKSHEQCRVLLDTIRDKAIFALKLTRIDGPLPHAKEVKVQTGGLIGLASIMDGDQTVLQVENITQLINHAITQFGSQKNLPYDAITRYIVNYEARQRRRGRKD